MRKRLNPLDPKTMELAFAAAEMRKDLDAVMEKHNARLQLGWEGKWAYLQAVFKHEHQLAVTLLKVDRGGKLRYLTEVEENK